MLKGIPAVSLCLVLGAVVARAQGSAIWHSEPLSAGGAEMVLSRDGRFVAFSANTPRQYVSDVFVHDRQTGITTFVSINGPLPGGEIGNATSKGPSISDDGRFVAFWSSATNLVPGDTNGGSDVFVHDRQTSTTTRVSVSSLGAQGTGGGSSEPSISADGRFVAFISGAVDLVAGDTNDAMDVFVHDRQTGATTRVSVSSLGTQAAGVVSASSDPSISADGRFVAFKSYFADLVAGDTNGTGDVFVHDRQTGVTTCVSVDAFGVPRGAVPEAPAISDDGRFVAFLSGSANLVEGDTNGLQDVFLHDRQSGRTTRVNVSSAGAQANCCTFGGSSNLGGISGDGRFVTFTSRATSLVAADANGSTWDVFVHDRVTGATSLVGVDGAGVQYSGGSGHGATNGQWIAFGASEGYRILDLGPLPPFDPNGDRRMDLLWHHRGDGRLSAWLMNGTALIEGRFLSHQVPDTTWEPAGIGDLDGDGHADIVWQNRADGRVSAWFMDGYTLREGTLLGIPQVADTDWRICSVGDLNGDDRADLIWQHRGDGRISAWLMDGAHVLAGTLLDPPLVADTHWRIVGSADFDGNGSRDLVWHHQADGRLAVWFMSGLTMVSGVAMNPGQVADTTWQVRGVGDLNGDGHPDLIWQNVTDGRVSAWLMAGVDLMEGTLLSPSVVADANWRIIGPR